MANYEDIINGIINDENYEDDYHYDDRVSIGTGCYKINRPSLEGYDGNEDNYN